MNWLLMITVTFENFRQSWQCTCSNYILNYCLSLSLRNLSKWLKEEKKNQKTKKQSLSPGGTLCNHFNWQHS